MKPKNKAEARDAVVSLIRGFVGAEITVDLADATTLSDLGFDSLEPIEFLQEVEPHFGIDLSDVDWDLTTTIGEIVETVAKVAVVS